MIANCCTAGKPVKYIPFFCFFAAASPWTRRNIPRPWAEDLQAQETLVTLTTLFENNDYRDILRDACETVQDACGCSVRVISTSYTTGDSTVTLSPQREIAHAQMEVIVQSREVLLYKVSRFSPSRHRGYGVLLSDKYLRRPLRSGAALYRPYEVQSAAAVECWSRPSPARKSPECGGAGRGMSLAERKEPEWF